VVDTGSWGLRLFASKLKGISIANEPVTAPSGQLGECASFGSGVSWGSVANVDVYIAGELAKSVPIQIMDDIGGFATVPADCKDTGTVFSSPTASNAGFNGILGVGDLTVDSVGPYYSCASGTCSRLGPLLPVGVTPVENPAVLMQNTADGGFAADYNGVALAMNAASAGGQPLDYGWLTFGIGTQPNNIPGPNVKVFTPNGTNTLTVTYENSQFSGFIDSGSNGIFFNAAPVITQCSVQGSSWYCPNSPVAELAVNHGNNGTSDTVNFTVANASQLIQPGFDALPELAGPETSGLFDWGLPLFYGRTIYVGFNGEVSPAPLGSGPFWAY